MAAAIGSVIFAFVKSFLLLNIISVYLIAQAGALGYRKYKFFGSESQLGFVCA